jgi:processive 1,2-diacylglycerol beta-glucosyltransferase
MNVLFLSVSTGEGHIRAAEALKEHIEDNFSDSQCKIIDTFKYINPFLDKLVVGSYLNLINKLPVLYGNLYKLSEYNESIINITNSLSRLFSCKLIPLIKDFNPTIIVCTHTLPFQMVSYLKEKSVISIPLTAIVTDYVYHPFWKLNNIDALIVPNEKIMSDMIEADIPKNIIYPYGIPLTEKFLNKKNKEEIMSNLGFEEKLTGLIMGGSLGIRSVYSSFKMVFKCSEEMQIIIVTGRNTYIKKKLEKELAHYKINNPDKSSLVESNSYICNNKKIILYGYTDKISELMDISDFIITKPGGMTISEALVKELPIFLAFPIPGQEERNCRFLVENGMAIYIEPKKNLNYILNDFFYNNPKIEDMKKQARTFARPDSCYNTALLLNKLQS